MGMSRRPLVAACRWGRRRWGLTGKLDLVATADGEAVPVETKRRRGARHARAVV